jgi:hypothetical protein
MASDHTRAVGDRPLHPARPSGRHLMQQIAARSSATGRACTTVAPMYRRAASWTAPIRDQRSISSEIDLLRLSRELPCVVVARDFDEPAILGVRRPQTLRSRSANTRAGTIRFLNSGAGTDIA